VEAAILRIIDANANRAREGLRVVEDVARFVLDDESLSSRAKECRHLVTQHVEALHEKTQTLKTSRDSEGDVGREGFAGGEAERDAVSEIVMANSRRVQEALRVLEEFSKLDDAQISSKLKDLRYSVYTLERNILAALAKEE
jgi:thiamine-phosphate pyrophosphorylase